uniref:Uncharacterized protein n=1 Tax=Anguilla anguilla TaxID=7936 RepID=A0A0E9PZ52_ANGAN
MGVDEGKLNCSGCFHLAVLLRPVMFMKTRWYAYYITELEAECLGQNNRSQNDSKMTVALA